MDERRRRRLGFHGAIVIVLGLLAGFPFALVILGQMQGDLRAWRMAHLEGVLNGLLLWAAAGVGPVLRLSQRSQDVLLWSLVIVAYGNTLASVLAATSGERGLEPGGNAANMTVYVAFMLAVVAMFVALGYVAGGSRPRR